MNTGSADLAYIAGFFDGEGCIRGVKGNSKYRNHRIWIIVVQKDPFILRYIQSYFNFGGVDYRKNNNIWRYYVNNREEVKEFLNSLLPYLLGKKAQADVALEFIRRATNEKLSKWDDGENKIREELIQRIGDLKREAITE